MNAVNSKTFKSGNSVAVRLPKEVAFPPDTPVTIERKGEVLTIRPALDPTEEKRKVAELVAALRALPKPREVEKRARVIPPVRRGL